MKPLQDRRILVTRRSEQAGPLVDGLRALGATVVEVPLIAREPPEDAAPLDRALDRLTSYEWLAFTSANAVQAVADRLAQLGIPLPAGVRLASVGPTTARAIAERFRGRRVELQPASGYRAEGLVEAFRAHGLAGRRVLLPVSDRARDTLAAGLRAQGADVDRVVAYRTVMPDGARDLLERALADGIDLAVLASPSAVEALTLALGGRAGALSVAVIGPVTEQAAREAGLDVRVVGSPSTVDGLLAALPRAFPPGATPP
ncbi:MAG TPA: uroporphyrinogen-III synthase [Vicinamibacteria bacterium]